MTATLDGHDIRALSEYRATSDAFTLEILLNSLASDFGYTPGARYPSVADGYYVMLKPLTPGGDAPGERRDARDLRCVVAPPDHLLQALHPLTHLGFGDPLLLPVERLPVEQPVGKVEEAIVL